MDDDEDGRMGRCIWSRKKVDATTIVGAVSKFYPRAAGKLAAPLAKEGLPSATTAELMLSA